MSATLHYLRPKFPTQIERDIYGDVPNVPRPDDEQIFGIPFPTIYPTKSRAAVSPQTRAIGGDVLRSKRRPRLIRGSVMFALECLAVTAALFVASFVISLVWAS